MGSPLEFVLGSASEFQSVSALASVSEFALGSQSEFVLGSASEFQSVSASASV